MDRQLDILQWSEILVAHIDIQGVDAHKTKNLQGLPMMTRCTITYWVINKTSQVTEKMPTPSCNVSMIIDMSSI
jgi:hypothetical protein